MFGAPRKVIDCMISISGGTFYIFALLMQLFVATRKYKPTVIVGISSGYLCGLLYAIFGRKEMMTVAKRINLNKVLKFKPYGKKGKITIGSLLRFGIGDDHIVVQDVKNIMREIITKDIFYKYKNDSSSIPVLTTICNIDNNTVKKINVKDLDYEDFLIVSEAAVAAQGLVESVHWNGFEYWEGGLKNHNAGHVFFDEYYPKDFISINSRPDNWTVTKKAPTGAKAQLFRYIEITEMDKALRDIAEQRDKSHHYDNAVFLFMDRLLKTPYDTNWLRQKRQVANAERHAENQINQAT